LGFALAQRLAARGVMVAVLDVNPSMLAGARGLLGQAALALEVAYTGQGASLSESEPG